MEKPILLGVDGQARQIVDKYGCGIFFEPENEESFVKGIDQIKKVRTRLELKSGCRKLVNDYERNIIADRMLEILKQ